MTHSAIYGALYTLLSYRKLSMMYGGEFVDFDSEHPILVNPFVGSFNEDKQDSLTEFLMSVITFNPRNRLDGIDEATIERAIVDTYERARDKEVVLEDVLERLRSQENGERGPYLAELLFKYSKKGRFGRYINGRNTLNTEKDLIVFNLDRIKNKELQAVHTDLHMRSDHSTEGLSGYQLSDLRLQYTDNHGDLRTLDAEIDVGYSTGLIAAKMSALPGMVWLTDSRAQAQKIEGVARSLDQDARVLVI